MLFSSIYTLHNVYKYNNVSDAILIIMVFANM